MISLYETVGRRTGKDPGSIKRFIEREALFPDLAEIAQDNGDRAAIDTLEGIVKKCKRRIRNQQRRR